MTWIFTFGSPIYLEMLLVIFLYFYGGFYCLTAYKLTPSALVLTHQVCELKDEGGGFEAGTSSTCFQKSAHTEIDPWPALYFCRPFFPNLIVSCILTLPLSGARHRQLFHNSAHLTQSLHAPAPHDTHLDSITFLITSPIYVTLLG